MTDHTPDKALLVSAAQLVDGRGGAPLADAGVLVDANGMISWVGPMAQAPQLPDHGRRVALAGTLLPGFIDTHVHFAVPGGGLNVGMLMRLPPPVRVLQIAANMRATVDAGVTTVRDLGFLGPKLAMLATTGATPAPRLLNAIAMLSSTGGHGDIPLPAGVDLTELFQLLDMRLSVADGPDEATKQARQLMRDGAQVIKVAATGGVSTPADGPDDVGFSLAELSAVVEAASSRGRRVAAHAIGTKGIANAVDAGVRSIEHGCGLTPEIAARMAERGAFLVPTLTVLNELGDPAVMGQQAYQKAIRWRAAASEAVPMAVKAGVRIATGTDAGLGIRHGQNLIELAHLVDAGLSPMDAIVAGTATAADVGGLGDQIGTLEPGKRADLVVAAGNPLDDIDLLADAGNITLVVRPHRQATMTGADAAGVMPACLGRPDRRPIAKEFRASLTTLHWANIAFTVLTGSLVIAGGRLGDLLGRRRVLVTGTVVFALASVVAAGAPNPAVLIIGRAVMGVGAALILP